MQKVRISKLKLILAIIMSAAALASCGGKGVSSQAEAAVSETQVTEVTTTPTVTTKKTTTTTEVTEPEIPQPVGEFNNLTGVYDLSAEAVGKRPVAVMVNNITFSLPQYGIAAADMIIECPVEGTITRLMAVYGDMTKIPNVCSIRSCRYYFPIIAQSFDAVYVHWGKDETVARQTLEDLGVDRLDGYSNSYVFDRDQERMQYYAYEHTGYFKGPLAESAIDGAGIRKQIKDDKNKPVFSFAEEPQKLSDTVCTYCDVPFSSEYFSEFFYNEEEGVYYKNHNGSPHMDVAENKQLSFENVFALGTSTEVINPNNHLISLDWHGGDGYYLSQGTIVPIKWSKADEFADIVITDTEGNIMQVNPGKSYIGFTPRLWDIQYS